MTNKRDPDIEEGFDINTMVMSPTFASREADIYSLWVTLPCEVVFATDQTAGTCVILCRRPNIYNSSDPSQLHPPSLRARARVMTEEQRQEGSVEREPQASYSPSLASTASDPTSTFTDQCADHSWSSSYSDDSFTIIDSDTEGDYGERKKRILDLSLSTTDFSPMNPLPVSGLYKVPEKVIPELGKSRSQVTNEEFVDE